MAPGHHLLTITTDTPNRFVKCELDAGKKGQIENLVKLERDSLSSFSGDATLHAGRTLHYAFGNKTGVPRRGYIGKLLDELKCI